MKLIKMAFASLALLVSAVTVATPVAFAQGAKIVVVDEGRILRDSALGRDLSNKLSTIQQQVRNELEPEAKALETEGEALDAKLANKTQEAVAADQALVAELNAYGQKAQIFNAKQKRAAAEYQATERKALVDFNKALEPLLMEVISEKNADIVMSRGSVVFSNAAVDISADVISKLDANTTTMNVVRQKISTQPQQQ